MVSYGRVCLLPLFLSILCRDCVCVRFSLNTFTDLSHDLFQCIQVVVCSPFLRCLQTCREILSVLNLPPSATPCDPPSPPSLPGMHLSNGVVDVFNRGCGIRQQPEVPTPDVESYGLTILSRDSQPLPKYPEKTQDGLHRYPIA